MQTGFKFISEVDGKTGRFPRSVRKEFRCGDHYWESGGFNEKMGHRYLSLNTLGCSNLAPVDLMNKIKMNLGAVFPRGSTGSAGNQSVHVGNVFDVRPRQTHLVKVRVESVDPWSFTLRTQFLHPLAGTARHGVIKDCAGELWLVQQGLGESGEWWVQIKLAYHFAPAMWSEMAQNIRRAYL